MNIKSHLTGNQLLVNIEDWIPLEQMNTDIKILEHPIFEKCFNKIVENHVVTNKTALISLCTSSRPYNKSRKWKVFLRYQNYSDLMVISSGGVIPQPYWNSYPYLNYDGDSHKSANDLYMKVMSRRLLKFFQTHRYSHIVANFRPNQRNTSTIREVLTKLKKDGYINTFDIIPDDDLYNDIQRRGFPSGMIFPDIDECVLEALDKSVGLIKYDFL